MALDSKDKSLIARGLYICSVM